MSKELLKFWQDHLSRLEQIETRLHAEGKEMTAPDRVVLDVTRKYVVKYTTELLTGANQYDDES